MPQFTRCKSCGFIFEKQANFCPQCGAKNDPPIFTKWWFWLIVFILLAGLASRSNSEKPKRATNDTGNTIVSSSDSSDTVPENTKAAEPKLVFEEITVVDNDECTIKITEIDPDDFWGYTLKVYLENKSTDKTYMFTESGASVDGIDTDPIFAVEVAPGKKAIKELSFSANILEELDIKFTDIEITFRVYDYNDWRADPVALETINVYPYGEEYAVKYVHEIQETDIVLIDNENVTAIVTGFDPDGTWGYTVNIFLANKTDAEAMFTVDEESVNGYMIDAIWATTVLPGKCKFSTISWYDSSLEECGITEVEEIEFLFKAYNKEKATQRYIEQIFTLKP